MFLTHTQTFPVIATEMEILLYRPVFPFVHLDVRFLRFSNVLSSCQKYLLISGSSLNPRL